jgi:hypothetical protein
VSDFSGINPERLLSTITSLKSDGDRLRASVGWMKTSFDGQGLDTQSLKNLLSICAWVDDQLVMLKRRHDLTLVSDKPYPGFSGMVQIDEREVNDRTIGIALRMLGRSDGVHFVNISEEQMQALKAASLETGVSEDLLLAIVWQEQQWYQNFDSGTDSFVADAGRIFDWTLEQTIKPDKSLGITHMKIATARKVMDSARRDYTVNGQFIGDLSDAQLAKWIEENPGEDIRLSAYYLAQMKRDPHGSGSDKQLFLLYAADTPQVRDANARYGDATGPRGGAIHDRATNWDRLQPDLKDAQDWAALSDEQRRVALAALSVDIPTGQKVDLSPVYAPAGVDTVIQGTGPIPPGTPTPTPGPSPTPPKD